MLLACSYIALAAVFGVGSLALDSPGADSEVINTIHARQNLVKPPPCEAIHPPPTEHTTRKRFHKFAHAFVLTKNLTEAFSYIANNYTNHNPYADDGFDVAWDFLAPVWPTTNITLYRTLFTDDMGRLNYNASGVGEVIDRFRWENGCIVEHWDVGEVWPTGH
ncbi:hypothetical protein FSARC_4275 [Fusarium sarcochroum]|uniref:SnoaL-like domain-containing protein n=1 Tax=Fusarium sarcochroum TaxID=1208366 RepID=A0A8H4XBQ1_9HYPO|nr:hypothetical protein FSARC_4275 [Fusarium sarcochroum]